MTRGSGIVSLVFASLLLSAGGALGGTLPVLRLNAGDQVRFTLGAGREEGRVERVEPGGLSVRSTRSGELRHYLLSDLRDLELRTTREPGWGVTHGVGVGVVSGFVVGLIVGVAREDGESGGDTFQLDLGLLGYAFTGAAVGAAGGIVAAGIVESSRPDHEWLPVELSGGSEDVSAVGGRGTLVWSVSF